MKEYILYENELPVDLASLCKNRARQEIVRCRDCEYWQDNNGGYPNPDCPWGKDETPDADDFCSFGERMKGGAKMLDKVREAIEKYFAKYGRMPETVFMSESVFKQSAEESNPVLAAAFRPVLPTKERPVTIYGANVEIIPYPDELLIVGGVRVNV